MGFISEKIGKIRKPHQCHVCGETMSSTAEAVIYKAVDKELGFFTLYFHIECREYSSCWCNDDWETYSPGTITRKDVLDSVGENKDINTSKNIKALSHNCKSAATMLSLVNENIKKGCTDQYSRIKLVIGLLTEVLTDA